MSAPTHSKPGSRIRKFIKQESFGGFLLIFVTIIAVIWANSDYYDSYHHLWHGIKLGLTIGDFGLTADLHTWVNDGLMAMFFFVIGLEIKREVLSGELSDPRKAILPIAAAVGGMLIPALIYVMFNYDNPQDIHGWGIPMATDIAFALGMMSLLGKRVNPNLKIFLTALAIADDLGAILVIAFFYTDTIDLWETLQAFLFLGVLFGAKALGVRRTAFYAIVGLLGVWLSFIFSGIHATIAGVLIAFAIPSKPKISGADYIKRLKKIGSKSTIKDTQTSSMLSQHDAHALDLIAKATQDAESPSQRLEHYLHPFSAFVILPLFALANAGIRIEGSIIELLFHPVSIGIIVGLVLGKFLGISIMTQIVTRLKWTSLPKGVEMKQIYGVALLAGIGFTMSIFISDLAFEDPGHVQIAKVGVFAASILSTILGMGLLYFTSSKPKEESEEEHA